MTLELVVGAEEVMQLGAVPLGGVMLTLIAPVGCAVPRPAIPVTVAVRVVTPPRVGKGEAARVMTGVCSARFTALAVAEAAV